MDDFQSEPVVKQESGLNIKEMFFKYVRFLPLFVISVALAYIVAYVYLRYATPVYQSSGTMLISDDSKKPVGQGQFDQVIAANNARNIQNEIEVLKSRPLMERVVTALNLNFSYYLKGKVKEQDLYKASPIRVEIVNMPDSNASFDLHLKFKTNEHFTINETAEGKLGVPFTTSFGTFKIIGKAPVLPTQEFRINHNSTFNIASNLAGSLMVAPKGAGLDILIFTLEATNPDFAADVINRTMQDYRQYTLEKTSESNMQSMAFIQSRLNVVEHELDSINKAKNAFMRANNIVSAETQSEEYIGKLSQSNTDIALQNVQMDVLAQIESYLRSAGSRDNAVPSSLTIQDGTLSGLVAQYNVAQFEKKAMLEKQYSPSNPLVKEADAKIESIRQSALESIQTVKRSFQLNLQSLQRQRGLAQGQLSALPAKQQQLADISLQQQSKIAVLNYFMQQREGMAIAIAGNTVSSRPVDPALPNWSPVRPKTTNVRLMALVIGLILPALFIFILEVLNDKINGKTDIQKITEATILGEVGHSYNDSPLVVTNNSRTVVAEQFRIIRSNLQYVLNHIEKPTILVTSSFSGEGKSFISTNIGAVMALAGKKTVILEFDIRKPKILSHLGMAKTPGLTNYILGKVTLEQVPTKVPGYDNLFVFPCGPLPPNPSELLLDQRIPELFAWLKANFDAVIVDTAPVGMVSDALTLSRYADATLYITRQGHTYKKQIQLIDDFYRSKKMPKLSIILNDVKVQSGYGYYGYGQYGYGQYGYGSGYFEDEEVPSRGLFARLFGKRKKPGRKKTHSS